MIFFHIYGGNNETPMLKMHRAWVFMILKLKPQSLEPYLHE